jgi:hypothetical protein
MNSAKAHFPSGRPWLGVLGVLALAAAFAVSKARADSLLGSPTAAATEAASGITLCNWGGTPAQPTGEMTITPGLNFVPAAGPLKFHAWGPLTGGGPCKGQQMDFVGILDAGSGCVAGQVFEGKVDGLPGVSRFWGPGAFGLVDEFLYDKYGNVVGKDQAQILSATPAHALSVVDCSTAQGFTPAGFSATVQLFGSVG